MRLSAAPVGCPLGLESGAWGTSATALWIFQTYTRCLLGNGTTSTGLAFATNTTKSAPIFAGDLLKKFEPRWVETPFPPAPPDLIPGVMKRHGVHLIVGERDVGKSLIALEIAASTLTGMALWGKIPVPHPIAKVTYILGEHDSESLAELWELAALLVPEQSLCIVGPEYRQPLVTQGRANLPAVQFYQEIAKGSGLIIFDPLSAFMSGSEAENDNSGMREVINITGDIARPNAAAVLILHHMGKPTFNPKTGQYEHPPTYASRGASSIEDAGMGIFYLTRPKAREEYRLKRGRFKARNVPSFYLLGREAYRHTLIARGLTEQEKATRAANAASLKTISREEEEE